MKFDFVILLTTVTKIILAYMFDGYSNIAILLNCIVIYRYESVLAEILSGLYPDSIMMYLIMLGLY